MKKVVEFLKEIDLFYLLMMWWIISSVINISFSASTDKGVSVEVLSKQEQKAESKKEPNIVDDGPKADWK